MPTVDVIIPACKPGKEFLELIDRLSVQTAPVRRIIIMNTEEKYFERLIYGKPFYDKYKNVSVYHLSAKEFDHGATRHRGVMHSKADIFLCMTQDAVPADGTLVERLAEAVMQEGVAVAYARQLPKQGSGILERCTREFNYPAEGCVKSLEDLGRLGIKAFFCSNVCAAYRREAYDKLGGFIRHTVFNEDMIFAAGALRHGFKIAYVPQAQVYHSHDYTLREQFRRNFDLGVSQADHPEVFAGVPAESEGIRLVKRSAAYLKEHGHRNKLPALLFQSGFKYAGFRLGRCYRRLPRRLVTKCSMNPNYWS